MIHKKVMGLESLLWLVSNLNGSSLRKDSSGTFFGKFLEKFLRFRYQSFS